MLVVDATLNLLLLYLVDVEFTLLHQDVKGAEVFIFEVDRGLRHIVVNNFRKNVDVSCCVSLNPLNKMSIFLGSKKNKIEWKSLREVFFDVIKGNFNQLAFFVGNLLLPRS